jgi:hypothetical protein
MFLGFGGGRLGWLVGWLVGWVGWLGWLVGWLRRFNEDLQLCKAFKKITNAEIIRARRQKGCEMLTCEHSSPKIVQTP